MPLGELPLRCVSKPSGLGLDPDFTKEPGVGDDARHGAHRGPLPWGRDSEPDGRPLFRGFETLVLWEVPVVGHQRLVQRFRDILVAALYQQLDRYSGRRPSSVVLRVLAARRRARSHPAATFSSTTLVNSSRLENGILAPAAMLCPPPTPPTLSAAALITS